MKISNWHSHHRLKPQKDPNRSKAIPTHISSRQCPNRYHRKWVQETTLKQITKQMLESWWRKRWCWRKSKPMSISRGMRRWCSRRWWRKELPKESSNESQVQNHQVWKDRSMKWPKMIKAIDKTCFWWLRRRIMGWRWLTRKGILRQWTIVIQK